MLSWKALECSELQNVQFLLYKFYVLILFSPKFSKGRRGRVLQIVENRLKLPSLQKSDSIQKNCRSKEGGQGLGDFLIVEQNQPKAVHTFLKEKSVAYVAAEQHLQYFNLSHNRSVLACSYRASIIGSRKTNRKIFKK